MQSLTKNLEEVFFLHFNQSSNITLVSPFIGYNISNKILGKLGDKKLKILTRFNLNDFRSGVSSLAALEKLHNAGVEIKGLNSLHAKTYIFDNITIITTSANLTNGGFYNNLEHGVCFDNVATVMDTKSHIDFLWSAGINFDTEEAKIWKEEIKRIPPVPKLNKKLSDKGGVVNQKIVQSQTFVKWMGTGKERAALHFEVFGILQNTGCNYAVCFSKSPRRYRQGDIVFISFMTENGDYAIFGRAKAHRFMDKRDRASEGEVGKIGWKKDWSYYIRIYDVEFIAGKLVDCPMLYRDVVNKLDYDAFLSTQQRHVYGELNINPRNSLRQKQDVRLSSLGSILLNDKFDMAKSKIGLIAPSQMKKLFNANEAIGF